MYSYIHICVSKNVFKIQYAAATLRKIALKTSPWNGQSYEEYMVLPSPLFFTYEWHFTHLAWTDICLFFLPLL